MKRTLDIGCSLILLLTVYPIIRLKGLVSSANGVSWSDERLLLLPQVFSGRISLVGRPLSDPDDSVRWTGIRQDGSTHSYLGPKGLTGLVQINRRDDLDADEAERYKLYYAKNHSLGLDLEIIVKSLLRLLKK